MNNSLLTAALAIGTAIIGLATLSVILSRGSATTDVIAAIGNAFGGAIRDAVSPITAGNQSAFTPQAGSTLNYSMS